MRLGKKGPGKNFEQPIGVFREERRVGQPHTPLAAKKKYKAAYACVRAQNLLEQRRDKNCLEPNHPAIHSKRGRVAGAARDIGKRGANRVFGAKKCGGCSSKKRGPKKKTWLLQCTTNERMQKGAGNGPRRVCRSTLCRDNISKRPKNDPFHIPNRREWPTNHTRNDPHLGGVSARRNRKNTPPLIA